MEILKDRMNTLLSEHSSRTSAASSALRRAVASIPPIGKWRSGGSWLWSTGRADRLPSSGTAGLPARVAFREVDPAAALADRHRRRGAAALTYDRWITVS